MPRSQSRRRAGKPPRTDRAPDPFNEHVIAPAALAVHRDADAVFEQQADKRAARELTSLIGVEDVRLTVLGDRLFDCLGAEGRVHRDRQPPRHVQRQSG